MQRARHAVSEALGGPKLFFSGAMLTRFQIPQVEGDMQRNSSGDEFAPHVDKANVASYDWSALLYFSTAGEDFQGQPARAQRMLKPVRGRLAFFSSGLEPLGSF
ncbi:unnamed protein product [Effrenium voratum]|nr:unnamed protein product [Effrenium voratum]